MCGRMTLTLPEFEQVLAILGVKDGPPYRPRYNVAPTDAHPLLIHDGARRLVQGRWGMGPRRAINARAETAGRTHTFRTASRCVVPADGFYEWDSVTRVPRWFHAAGPLLFLAGLRAEDRTFAVLTVPANALVGAVHDRMPAILHPDEVDAWLTGESVGLGPAPDGALLAHDVDARVGNVRNDDPACIAPRAPPRQRTLFD